MANKRELKRDINGLLGDVIEECYDYLLNGGEDKEKEIEAIVDESVDLADDLIARVNAAGKMKDGKQVRAEFGKIREELGEKVVEYIERLNKL